MDSTVNKSKLQLLRKFSFAPLKSPEEDRLFFVNFEDEIRRIEFAIKSEENVLIVGERGSGKSSVLNRIYHQLSNSKTTIPILFSGFRLNDFTQASFSSVLLDNVFEVANKYGTLSQKVKNTIFPLFASREMIERRNLAAHGNLPNIQADEVSRELNAYKVMEQLTKLIFELKRNGMNICVMIDDTDKFEAQQIWNTFRGIRDILWEMHTSLVITCTPSQVNEMTKPPLDHFFPNQIQLKAMNPETTEDLINKRAKDAGVNIDLSSSVINTILERSEGNPRRIIEITRNLIESSRDPHQITPKEVESLGVIYKEKMSDLHWSIINYLITKPNTSAASPDFIKEMGVKRARLSQILNELKREGFVGTKKEGRKMVYYVYEDKSTNYKKK